MSEMMCLIMRGPCTHEGCVLWELVKEGGFCPIGMEKVGLQAIATALQSGAQYADQIFGIDPDEAGDLASKIAKSMQEGKFDLRKLVEDFLSLEPGQQDCCDLCASGEVRKYAEDMQAVFCSDRRAQLESDGQCWRQVTDLCQYFKPQ